MTSLRAGEFKHRVYVEEPVETQSQFTGEVTKAFVSLTSQPLAAAIEPDNGNEFLAGGLAVAGQLYTRIRLRWSPLLANIGPSHRIVRAGLAGRDDVTYNIVAVVEPGFDRKQIVLRCTSGVNLG